MLAAAAMLAERHWPSSHPPSAPRPESSETPDPGPAKRATASDIRRFEQLAEKACLCARSHKGGDWESACWNEFDRSTAAYQPQEWATMCMDASSSGYCFEGGKGGKPCITANRSQSGACTPEESKTEQKRMEAQGTSC